MKKKKQKPANRRSPGPGPEAETLKIEGDWKAAVKKALSKKPPVGGWPKPPKKRG